MIAGLGILFEAHLVMLTGDLTVRQGEGGKWHGRTLPFRVLSPRLHDLSLETGNHTCKRSLRRSSIGSQSLCKFVFSDNWTQ
ncbi:hypothetical protein EGN72_07205 [Pseudorhodobacter sp. E13]|nr:hypothetical protein EGN72_07205 [Pseudorhodobacter sp. E13]